jgi:hypothetical protein
MSIGWLKERGIPRRAVLGGIGSVVALPVLESLLPKEARAQASAAPVRYIVYYVPNGHVMANWRPAAPGMGFPLSVNLQPLEMVKNDIMVISGLNNQPGVPDQLGDHAAGTASSFTAIHAFKSATTLKLGASVDQIAAQQNGMKTRIPSMQLGLEEGRLVGGCDSGYACAYSNSISWSSETTALGKVTRPQTAFDLLFSGGGAAPMENAAAQAKRLAYKKSVLDFAVKDAQTLAPKLGRSDNLKLDEYLTGVRETERRVLGASPGQVGGVSCQPGQAPAATMGVAAAAQVMSDIMVLAMQCDVTRIFSFMFANAVTGRTYPDLGATRGHHDISHHGNNANNLMLLTKISTFEVQQLAYLLNKMKAVQEGANNLLYNSTLVFTSDVSDGNRHNHDDMPVLVAGHGGGMLNTGQHIVYPTTGTKVRFGNMLSTSLRTVGVNKMVGDADGVLMEMLKV